MPTDNVPANPGSGSPVRTLADAGGVEWAAGVCCFGVTISPGANVLQVVTAANPLPVAGTFWQATQPVSLSSLPPLAAGTNTIGGVSLQAATSGGSTPYRYIAAGSANQDSQVVKNAAGQVHSIALGNPSAASRFVKLYDKATAPTSADTPVQTYFLPAGGGNNPPLNVPLAFASGIGIRITTGMGDGDTGTAAAGDVCVSLGYK